jgi:glycosyltransferase involved in cell wall biosynthesis
LVEKASSPTKLAELMALGIPCLTNRGVGDVDEIMSRNPQGVLIDGWNSADYATAIEKMLKLPPNGRSQSRQMACAIFSLENGIAAYESIYEKITH